jgi:hypothetical protein
MGDQQLLAVGTDLAQARAQGDGLRGQKVELSFAC